MAYSSFESEYRVRPDDIDFLKHVHNSRYFDYVMAARYEHMERFYGMSIEQFMERGLGWVVKTAHVEYKRALIMGEYFKVGTGIETIDERGCRVKFTITSKSTGKTCSDGWFDYVMIDVETGKGIKIPLYIIEHYLI